MRRCTARFLDSLADTLSLCDTTKFDHRNMDEYFRALNLESEILDYLLSGDLVRREYRRGYKNRAKEPCIHAQLPTKEEMARWLDLWDEKEGGE